MLAMALVALFAAAVIAAPADKAGAFLAKRGAPHPPIALPDYPGCPETYPRALPPPPPPPCAYPCGGSCIPPGTVCCGESGNFCPSNCQCSTSGHGEHLVHICLAPIGLDIDVL
ncbi:hypothetical protein CcaverHIS002_0606550 [Cutaneotrichosporon cavernicola]|uniref:WAP domain-containing protein n=1 Tax=Cutaneotrichosporon cavernicola TaxID=279322 RepID=A0AA48QYB4_9TREE|nr:uncharacterized protein CcaverHIS019_0605990 [Cutaneotrichosporon cavernicola]BEI86368.1 hypothetical protein CcaverHIS002_0606550 [Cutaneotrichosporon cavernicola]BEI94140.1 hypothetical protein CcaverHIS019_0605990 [Cutaneotrichosporon cavernicola]BEJ01920.1 hypothetical protein CcaverHIS631_0606020 [Cutaneotrichosporon cavernicola]BEJ09684.1 hypothetical protein CcaverHIS641_0605990 [Cutaneotrichosporon cavernicola]